MIGSLGSITTTWLADVKHYPRKDDWVPNLYQRPLYRGFPSPDRNAIVPVHYAVIRNPRTCASVAAIG